MVAIQVYGEGAEMQKSSEICAFRELLAVRYFCFTYSKK